MINKEGGKPLNILKVIEMIPDLDRNLNFRQLNYLITDLVHLTEQLTYDLIDKNKCSSPLRDTLKEFIFYLSIYCLYACLSSAYLSMIGKIGILILRNCSPGFWGGGEVERDQASFKICSLDWKVGTQVKTDTTCVRSC